jgi:hypothetical protein
MSTLTAVITASRLGHVIKVYSPMNNQVPSLLTQPGISIKSLRVIDDVRRSSSAPPSKSPLSVPHWPSVPPLNGRMWSLQHGARSETPLQSKEHTSLDLMAHLQRSGASVVKTRTGSVLSRGFILKTDYYPSGSSFSHVNFPCLGTEGYS